MHMQYNSMRSLNKLQIVVLVFNQEYNSVLKKGQGNITPPSSIVWDKE